MRILNIIFDLGGVIIDLDVQRTYDAFSRLLENEPMKIDSGYLRSSLQTDYEVGAIDSESFLAGLEGMARAGTSREDIVNAWNSMLLRLPQERVDTLKKLATKYRIFILSNTNELHEDYFERMAPGCEKLSDIFEAAYYSHRIACRKPDAEAFKIVMERSGLNPEDTLFVDDLETNIEAAKKMKLHTLHVRPGVEISEYFKNW